MALCFFAMFLTWCSSNYVIATKEGQMLLTKNKLALDKDIGLLSYLDEDGQWRQINNEVVSQIVHR
ncbi:MAG: YgdI/YgdR family lipoprotein [Symbiopectobacterium sp.]